MRPTPSIGPAGTPAVRVVGWVLCKEADIERVDERLLDALQREPSPTAWRQVVGALLNRADRPLLLEHTDVLEAWPRDLRATNRAMCRRLNEGHVPCWMAVFKVFALREARIRTPEQLESVLHDVTDLESLSMRYAQLGLRGAEILAHRNGLRRLEMVSCGLDTEGLRLLASAGHFERLEHLNLANNRVDDGCLDILLGSRLKTLNLYQNRLGHDVRDILKDWSIERGVRLNL